MAEDEDHGEKRGPSTETPSGIQVKKKKLSDEEKYRPPTSEELHQLKETENLFHSNLFRMQISELLKEVLITDKKRRKVDNYIQRLTETLLTLKQVAEHKISKPDVLKKSKVKLPLIVDPQEVKGKFQFLPPTKVKVIGSYQIGTSLKRDAHVDLCVEIPKECLQPKDYLNQRYLRKRAFYLAYVASQLKNSLLVKECMFQYHHGNCAKPVLLITPAESVLKHVTVYIHPSLPDGFFKMGRFHLNKNNVRPHWYQQKGAEGDTEEKAGASEVGPPTPLYNTCMLQDMSCVDHCERLQEVFSDSQGLKEGVLLLKVWLHQRELDVGYGGFTGFILTMYVLYLLTQRKLNRGMSSYQVMRNTLIHLGQAKWMEQGISLCSIRDVNQPDIDDFHSVFDVVFVDSSGFLNFCAHMHSTTFERVKHEANLSIQFLETAALDAFDVLFMKPVPFMHKYDLILHLTDTAGLKATCSKCKLEEDVMDHCGDFVLAAVPRLMMLLKEAVGSRVKMMQLRQSQNRQWHIDEDPPGPEQADKLTVGFLLDPDTATSILERGPPADSSEAKEFQKFWGDKSELRRFQDGSICEAVVWPASTLADRRNVIVRVIKHILHLHAGISKKSITSVSHQLSSLLKVPLKNMSQDKAKETGVKYGTGEEQIMAVMNSFNSLRKQLRSLKSLPLTISSVQGTDPVFRFAEVFPPLPAEMRHGVRKEGNRLVPVAGKICPPHVPTLKVLVMLESSGKWPDDHEAVKRLKAAFHVQLGQALTESYGLLTEVYPTHVWVLKDGFVFELHIGYKLEISLAKTVRTPEGMVKMMDSELSALLEKELLMLPKLSSTLHGLQQQHNSYTGSVRLAKRWLAAQLLLDQLPGEAVELLVAHIYLHPAPYTVPGSSTVGFLRWLRLMATHNWSTTPLIVNLNEELQKGDLTEIENNFSKNRSTLPLMFVASPLDKFHSALTRKQPIAPLLQHLALLASQSLQVLLQQMETGASQLDMKQVFRPPLEAYNVLIHLRDSQIPHQHERVDVTTGTLLPSGEECKSSSVMPVVNYDPVQIYLEELRDAFDDIALFLYDPYGGPYIAVLWKPTVKESSPFKVLNVGNRKPDLQNKHLIANIDAVIEDFSFMGQGLVKSVELCNT